MNEIEREAIWRLGDVSDSKQPIMRWDGDKETYTFNGHYRLVEIPGKHAHQMQQEVVDRDCHHREGFLFDYMLRNKIHTKVVIGKERSYGHNGMCISQARTPGDGKVILYSDHNLFPVAAIDFLKGKHFGQQITSVAFEDKPAIAIWRGNDTGRQGPIPGQDQFGLDKCKISRRVFVETFETSDRVDCAIVDNSLGQRDPVFMLPSHQVNKHKYLIYLEGNDAGSNPRWIFSTQCVVFAPDVFTSELTWHYHMKPWINYIPFKHDLSDLHDKIEWAENNQSKCKQIIESANTMHSIVTDVHREHAILKCMFDKYVKNIEFE